jgi:DNA-binding LacI/PurR family transcriptional regulator
MFRVARQRLAGYREAYTAASYDWSRVVVYEVPMNARRGGREATHALLQEAPNTTAVLAIRDELALDAAPA